MLPFMREQRLEDLTGPKPPAEAGNIPAPSNEAAGGQQYLTVASRSRQVRKNTIQLAVLFGIGLLCLFFMIKKTSPQSAAAKVTNPEDAKIEMAISRFGG
jgi:hypothetical protein